MAASAGASYLWRERRFAIDILAGTGARTTQPNGPINGASLPSSEQINVGISRRVDVPGVGAVKLRFDVINLFDESYRLRSSTSLGAFAPAYGSHSTYYGGISKEF